LGLRGGGGTNELGWRPGGTTTGDDGDDDCGLGEMEEDFFEGDSMVMIVFFAG